MIADSVAGLVGGGQAGDTSEQIAALDRKNPGSQAAPVGYEKEPIAYESSADTASMSESLEDSSKHYKAIAAGPVHGNIAESSSGMQAS